MNKRLVIIIIGAVLLGVLFFTSIRILTSKNQGPASLRVTAQPEAAVFLDTQNLGKTPYDGTVSSGEYTLKLVPSSADVSSWQTKIKLSPGVLTVVNHEFGDQELTSAGEILTLEKISSKTAQIAVISTPDGAQVSLDDTPRGTTPLILENINEGEHQVSVSANGFITRGVKIRTTAGFKLIADFQLALSAEGTTPSATPSPGPAVTPKATPKASPKATPKITSSPQAELPRPYVKILETNLTCESTTCLNVRMEPNKSATISATVKTGETYPLLDEQNGWYKIKYQGSSEGWISGQYAEKYE